MSFDDIIHSRRSIRTFAATERSIPRDTIRKIISAGILAPSAGNLQPWRFTVLTHPADVEDIRRIIEKSHDTVKEKLSGTAYFQEEKTGCSEEKARGRDTKLKTHIQRLKKWESFFTNAKTLIFVFCRRKNKALTPYFDYLSENSLLSSAEQDRELGSVNIQSCAAAIENMLLKITDEGLGACWMQVPLFAKEDILNRIGRIDGYDLIAMIPLGIRTADTAAMQIPSRNDIDEVTEFR